ncbi:major facilitator superfamily domain-containing protein [Xylariomycetidae sp. FL2044]|nr:major facilitator superfamily domain-containing protein [Xylariomycetidae sp. FL2044]
MPSSSSTFTTSSESSGLPVDAEKQTQPTTTTTTPHPSSQGILPAARGAKDEISPAPANSNGNGNNTAAKDADGDDEKDAEQWQIQPEPGLFDTEADGVTGTLNRVLSKISTNASWNPGPPPDGGREAWLMCFCSHLVILNTWGFINSFGVFQSYYAEALQRPASDVSWIGSITVFLTFFVGTFTGRVTDAGFLRPVLACGTALMTLGIFATAAATRYWQLLLSQGLCMGLACGCIFCPAIATVSTYFSRRRSLALGITASGSVTGGLVFPAMARQLLPRVGFGWAVRAIGFVQVATLLCVVLFMRSRLPPRRAGSLVEWAAFAELEYTFYGAGMFFNFWGVYFAFYYVAAYARDAAEIAPDNLSYTESLNLLLLMNGVGLVGRLVPNYLADRLGPLNIMIPTCLACGALMLAWIAISTPSGLYAWAVFYGVFAGGIQSLFPAGLSSLTTDLRKQGTRMGMVFTIVSFAVLTGPPIAGTIIGALGGRYWGAFVFTGCSLLVGMGFIAAARWVRSRRDGTGWRVKI